MKKLDFPYYLELQRRLAEVILYVSCHEDNFGTYSIKIENLFVDICAFFDSLCQTFIVDQVTQKYNFINQSSINKFSSKVSGKVFFTMDDYKKLLEKEFDLSSKEINLNIYEDYFQFNTKMLYEPSNIIGYKIKPFDNWANQKSLKWWSAFTKLKHNRLANIKEATLEQTIYSLGATYIILSLKNQNEFKNGNVMDELYEVFYPYYWQAKGRKGTMIMWQ
jgi:hypothetical protein